MRKRKIPIQFTYDHFNLIKSIDWYRINTERKRLKMISKSFGHRVGHHQRHVLDSIEVLDILWSWKLELARQYLPRYYVDYTYLPDDTTVAFRKGLVRVKSRLEAERLVGLDAIEDAIEDDQ